MLGLLKNDLYCLFEEEFLVILMEIMIIITSITLRLSTPDAFLASFLLISLSYRCVTTDWDLFIDATLIKRRTIVLEKYIFCSAIIVVAAFVAFIISYFNVGSMVMSCAMPGLIKTMLLVLIYGLYDVGSTLFISFVFGKSRVLIANTLIKMLFTIIAMLGSIGSTNLSKMINSNKADINTSPVADIGWSYFVVVLFVVSMMFIVSLKISLVLYDRKEIP